MEPVPPGVFPIAFRRFEVELPEDTVADLLARLGRVEGQVRGLQSMLTEQRECADVVTQIAAAARALEQVGFRAGRVGPHLLPGSPG